MTDWHWVQTHLDKFTRVPNCEGKPVDQCNRCKRRFNDVLGDANKLTHVLSNAGCKSNAPLKIQPSAMSFFRKRSPAASSPPIPLSPAGAFPLCFPPLTCFCLHIMVHMLACAHDRLTKIILLKLLQPAQLQPALTVRPDQLFRLMWMALTLWSPLWT